MTILLALGCVVLGIFLTVMAICALTPLIAVSLIKRALGG